jgi:hypothetical protein
MFKIKHFLQGRRFTDFYGKSLQAQEKNLPATQKRAIPMITVPANERVFQAKINVGMETSRAG